MNIFLIDLNLLLPSREYAMTSHAIQTQGMANIDSPLLCCYRYPFLTQVLFLRESFVSMIIHSTVAGIWFVM